MLWGFHFSFTEHANTALRSLKKRVPRAFKDKSLDITLITFEFDAKHQTLHPAS